MLLHTRNFKLKTLLASIILSITTLSYSADNSINEPTDQGVEQNKPLSKDEFAFRYLLGEIAGQRGDYSLSSNIFFDLAKSERDPRLAERAVKVAIFSQNLQIAIPATQLWVELDPESIDAQQAITQLYVTTGNLKEAKPHLQKLLEKEDIRANGFMYLNGLLARQPDKNEVLKLIQDLALPYPSIPEAHFSIAHAANLAGKNDIALKELAICDKLRPGWEICALQKGGILSEESPSSALDFYRDFLSKNQNANEIRLSYAKLLVNQKRFNEAKPQFITLIKASNENPEILVVVGLLSVQSNDFAGAEDYFKRALNNGFKDKDQLLLYLGQIAEKKKDDQQALIWYKQVQPGDRYFEAKLNIANVISRTDSVDSAIESLNNLPDISPEQSALAFQTQANLLVQAKRFKEAFDLLGKAVTTIPNTPDLLYDYAMAAERINELDISEMELRKLIKLKPDFAQAYNALGYSLADRNLKLEEANQLIETALTLSPKDHYILDSMGWVQYRLGKLDKALEFLKQAYSEQTDPEIAAHLGEVLWQQGKHDEAMQTWETALKEYPDNETLVNTEKKFKQ